MKRRFLILGLLGLGFLSITVFPNSETASVLKLTETAGADSLKTLITSQSSYEKAQEVSFWSINTGQIGSTIGDRGIIGKSVPRFRTPVSGYCEYLGFAGIWFGSVMDETTSVSIAINMISSPTEFSPVRGGKYFPYVSDHSVWTIFADTGQLQFPDEYEYRPLNIRCVLKFHGWSGDPCGNAVLYDLIITNLGDEILEDGYIGIMIDSDIGYKIAEGFWWNDDLVGSSRDDHIVYFIDNDGDPDTAGYYDSTCMIKTLAAKFLRSSFDAADTSFNWWLYDQFDTLDFGPRMIDQYGSPFCRFDDSLENAVRTGIPRFDEDAYCLLSNGEWDYDLIRMLQPPPGWEMPPAEISTQYLNGDLETDVGGLLSLGPATIAPDSSIRVLFTFFTGDSVHTAVDNIDNLPQNPDEYLAHLNFDYVIANAAIADSLAGLLLDPQLAATGLYVAHNDADSVVIEWDPWVFSGIEGYDIALYEVPDDSLPYPGPLPPWITVDESAFTDFRRVDRTYRAKLDSLTPHHHYFVAVAHRLTDGVGAYCSPIPVQPYGMIPAPEPVDTVVYISADQPVVIQWTPPSDIAVDHYNIYKFDNWDDASDRYNPFYDRTDYSPWILPRDSFLVGGYCYFYYAMTPYAVIAGARNEFSEYIDATVVYVIMAVDSSGYESEFSNEILAFEIDQQEKDVLVITARIGNDFIVLDSVKSFYDSVLIGYDYDIYDLTDSLLANDMDSLYILRRVFDISHYKMVIFEDGLEYQLLDPIVNTPYRDHLKLTESLAYYLEAGGTLVYCGFFGGFTHYRALSQTATYLALDHWFIDDYFGIDSVFQIGLYYYHNTGVPYPVPDSLTGLKTAVCTYDSSLSMTYDLMRYPYNPKVQYYWDRLTPPGVGAFYPDGRSEITHVVDSRYPETSLIYSHPIGVKTESDNWTTYAFGFHLWYMDYDGARALIDTVFQKTSKQPEPVLPDRIALDQNFPNPFNAGTKIRFYLPWRSDVRIEIYNILGQRVLTLLKKNLDAGEHNVTWDGTDDDGRLLATGVYFYRLKAGTSTISRKMILLK